MNRPFVLIARREIFPIAKEGDHILVEPGGKHPVSVIRRLPPNYGRLAGALS